MIHHLFYSSCPVVRRSTETFVETAFVGGAQRRFEFEREILWLQESEANLRFVHGGVELMHSGSHTDYYGYLSAARNVVDDAECALKKYGVTAESSLVIEVVTRVYQRPVIEPDEAKQHNRSKAANRKAQWADVPDDWRKEVQVDGEILHPRLPRHEVSEEVVWSSKQTNQENAEMLAAFQARWSVSQGEVVSS
jgi:hypothetical protein